MNCLCYLIWSILLSHVFNTLKIMYLMNVSVGGFLRCFWFGTVIFPLPGWNRKKPPKFTDLRERWRLKGFPSRFHPLQGWRFRDCPHLVPCNQCLGSGTKWCCVHNLSTLYATVYIISQLSPCQTPFWNMSLTVMTKQWTAPELTKTVCTQGHQCLTFVLGY